MSQRISAVLGLKVTESRSPFEGHIVDQRKRFCLPIRRFVLEIFGVECKSCEKSCKKFDVSCAANLGEGTQRIFGGICK